MNNILNINNFSIFSIFDGHGNNGHHMSEAVKSFFDKYFSKSDKYYLPRKLTNSSSIISRLASLKNLMQEQDIYEKLVYNNYELINNAFNEVENEVKLSKYDSELSGSTSCVTFITGDKLICANVGDSRGIMVSYTLESSQKIISQISNDHKPSDECEKKRILLKGGVVRKLSDYGYEVGPARVFVKDERYPGLAMSRSIGDFVAKSVGVSSEPEILEFNITSQTKFIVLASDGLWEFMSNEQVAEIVSNYYLDDDPQSAANALIQEAAKCWIKVKYIFNYFINRRNSMLMI